MGALNTVFIAPTKYNKLNFHFYVGQSIFKLLFKFFSFTSVVSRNKCLDAHIFGEFFPPIFILV